MFNTVTAGMHDLGIGLSGHRIYVESECLASDF